MKKKLILSITIVISLLIIILLIVINHKNTKKEIEGIIIAAGDDYLLIETKEEDYIVKNVNSNYEKGDKIKVKLSNINNKTNPKEAKATKIEIIEKSKLENTTETENEEKTIFEEEKKDYNENEIIEYFEELNNDVNSPKENEETSSSIKEKFINIIDFIFYDKEIGNKKFSELTAETKLKLISLALKIDSKIDEHFPNYKENIDSKYSNIKNKLIEKYLNITTKICEEDEQVCLNAKEGFKSLKESFNITWDIIKNLAKKGIKEIKNWYEIWKYN